MLRSVNLASADLSQANLSGAHLEEVNFSWANLRGADLRWASLRRANLLGATLDGADLSGANLTGADMCWTDLHNANLTGAMLQEAILRTPYIANADFSEAHCGDTVFAFGDLSEAIGLNQVNHSRPSAIDVDILIRRSGEIRRGFLLGCGVPNNLIEFLDSTTGGVLAFHKCFISYTEKDDEFSERLTRDLRNAGVNCWRWKDDAKWGTSLMGQVERAIRGYDKLVVILSEYSLASEPVIREIERALQKEQRGGKEVLFPIRLDDAISSWEHELQADVVRKTIGDFRDWHDPEKYAESFQRLLASLEAPAMKAE